MKPMQITSWPIQKCKIAKNSFDNIFSYCEKTNSSSLFQKPFLAQKVKENIEIITDSIRFSQIVQPIKIPVYLIPDDISNFEILKLVLDYYLFDNELNPLVIAKILHHLDKNNIDGNLQKKFISQKLKISPKPKIVEKYKKYIHLEKNLTDFLIAKKAPLKAWDYVAEFSAEEQFFLTELICATKPSLGNFLEILENLSEVQKISKASLSDIYEQLNLIQILKSESKTKLVQIKEKIQLMRYPALTRHRQEIDALFTQITQPNNLNLQYDQNFEKREIRGFFSLTKETDFQALQKFFSSENSEKLSNILKKL